MKLGQRLHHRIEMGRRISLDQLKRCPVCGTVNAAPVFECVTCRWHGDFIQDHEQVEEGLNELLDRCPDLAEVVLTIPPKRRSRGIVSWLGMLRWLFRGRIDFRV